MPTALQYLGEAERLYPADATRGPLAIVRPLYRMDLVAAAWEAIEDVTLEFPARGRVKWFEPHPEAIEGTLWQFGISSISTFGPGSQAHDQYKVVGSPTAIRDVLDLGDGDPDMVRRWVTEEGLVLPFVPSTEVFIRADADLWVGPVRLVRSNPEGSWILPKEVSDRPLSTVYPVRQEQLLTLDIDGVRRLVLAPSARPTRLGQIDWAPDQLVLARALRWLRKVDTKYTTQLGLIGQAIDRAATIVNQTESTVNSSSLDAQRVRRARSIVRDLDERRVQAKGLLEDLVAIPAVASELEVAKTRILQQAEDEARTVAEAAAAELHALHRQVDEATAELARIGEAKQAAQAGTVDALDAALSERLQELMVRPERALADIAIVRAVLGLLSRESYDTPRQAVSVSNQSAFGGPSPDTWTRSGLGPAEPLTERKGVRQALAAACRARGVPPRVSRPLHVAFLAGAMPVLAGSGAYEAVEAYAAVVAAERLLWLPVPAGIVNPADLLGRFDPSARRFVPAPGGLADLLLHAGRSDALYVVVLDGINRAAVDAYLAPILACYSDAWRLRGGQSGRTLSLLNPAVAADDPYAAASRLAWPPNVLLASTLTDGVSVLPLPPSTWTSAVLIDLDQFDTETTADARPSPLLPALQSAGDVARREVPLATWCAWRAAEGETDLSACSDLLHEAQEHGLGLPRAGRSLCARFYVAGRTWGGDEDAAMEDMILHCLVPLAASRAEALIEFLAEVELTSPAVERAIRGASEVMG